MFGTDKDPFGLGPSKRKKKESSIFDISGIGLEGLSDNGGSLFGDEKKPRKPRKVKPGKKVKSDIFGGSNYSLFGDSSGDLLGLDEIMQLDNALPFNEQPAPKNHSIDIMSFGDNTKDDPFSLGSLSPGPSRAKPTRKKKAVEVDMFGEVNIDPLGETSVKKIKKSIKKTKQDIHTVQNASKQAGDAFNFVGSQIQGIVNHVNERRGKPVIDKTSLDPDVDNPKITQSSSTHQGKFVVTGHTKSGTVLFRQIANNISDADLIAQEFKQDSKITNVKITPA